MELNKKLKISFTLVIVFMISIMIFAAGALWKEGETKRIIKENESCVNSKKDIENKYNAQEEKVEALFKELEEVKTALKKN